MAEKAQDSSSKSWFSKYVSAPFTQMMDGLSTLGRLASKEAHDTISMNGLKDWALKESLEPQLPGRTGGTADAMRHILASADMTRQYGNSITEDIMGSKEAFDLGKRFTQNRISDATGWVSRATTYNNNPALSAMDWRNNEIGMQIGEFVEQQGGTREDILHLTKQYLTASLSGQKEAILNGNIPVKDGLITVGKDITLKLGDRTLTLGGLTLMPAKQWEANPIVERHDEKTNTSKGLRSPKDNNGKDHFIRISSADAFWPEAGEAWGQSPTVMAGAQIPQTKQHAAATKQEKHSSLTEKAMQRANEATGSMQLAYSADKQTPTSTAVQSQSQGFMRA